MAPGRPDGSFMSLLMGVISGFPNQLDMQVDSVEEVPVTGGLRYGYSAGSYVGGSDFAQGAITPTGARCAPGAAPLTGANGEVLQVVWYNSGNGSYPLIVYVVVRGIYTSDTLPFTTIKIGNRVFSKSSGAFIDASAGVTHISWDAGSVNPLPVGKVPIRFA